MARRILIVAGEASGDDLGGALVRAYRAAGGRASFVGMGGAEMRAAGVDVRIDAAGLAVMGAVEVVRHLPAIRRAYRTLRALLPQVGAAVLIDYQDFNARLARAARRRGVRVLRYVSPTVWAWRRGRVGQIRRDTDHMAVLLPFEAPFYEAHGVPVTYVGHPLLDAPRPTGGRAAARAALSLAPERPAVALLPGSRRFEVTALLPVMLEAAGRLQDLRTRDGRPPLQFVLPLASTVSRALVEPMLAASPVPVTLVEGRDGSAGPGAAARALAAADAAVTASGTATLETALCGTPMVIVYKVRPLTYLLGRLLIRVASIGLVNLIAERPFVRELIQGAATPEAIASEVAALLDDPARRAEMEAGLAEVRRRLGAPGASARAAAILLGMLGEGGGVASSAQAGGPSSSPAGAVPGAPHSSPAGESPGAAHSSLPDGPHSSVGKRSS